MKEDWPQIQVALDVVRLKQATRIARIAVSAGVGWIEAGTPLIKSEGMRSLRTLSRQFPNNPIVADMKTLDAGKIECEMAYQGGARIVSISGLAHDRTVRDSVRIAAKHDCLLMADLLMSPEPRVRARELQNLGVDIVCLHTGIDAQKALHSRLKVSRTAVDIIRSLRVPVAAAGGVTPDTAQGLLSAGVKIVVVGNWITGSRDPARAASQIVQRVRDAESARTRRVGFGP